MAFCGTCGKPVPDGANVCPNCGTALAGAAQAAGQMQGAAAPNGQQGAPQYRAAGQYQGMPQAPKPAKQMAPETKKKILTGVIAGVVALVAIIVIVAVILNMPHSFHVKDAVTITADGYDTVGSLKCKIDNEKLRSSIKKANSDLRENKINEVVRGIDVTLSEKDDVSNGQEITVTVNVNQNLLDDNKLTLAEDSWTYTVSGLGELQTIDPFDNIKEVKFNGTSPYLNVEIELKSTNGVYGAISYTPEPSENIKNGATIKVKAGYGTGSADSLLRNYGTILGTTEKSFTAEGMDEYIMIIADIDDSPLGNMQTESKKIITDYLSNMEHRNTVTYDEPLKYEGCILLTGTEYFGEEQNQIILIYSSEFKKSDDFEENDYNHGMPEPRKNYFPIIFYDVVKHSDGLTGWDKKSESVEGKGKGVGVYSYYTSPYDKIDGYESTTDLFQDMVRNNEGKYNYELSDEIKDLF